VNAAAGAVAGGAGAWATVGLIVPKMTALAAAMAANIEPRNLSLMVASLSLILPEFLQDWRNNTGFRVNRIGSLGPSSGGRCRARRPRDPRSNELGPRHSEVNRAAPDWRGRCPLRWESRTVPRARDPEAPEAHTVVPTSAARRDGGSVHMSLYTTKY